MTGSRFYNALCCVCLQNLSIRNCHGSEAVMQFVNTELRMYYSEFSNNGVVLRHSQIADDNCTFVKVMITGCVFNNDLVSRPVYEAAVELAGCDVVKLDVTESQFLTAPLIVSAELHSEVSLTDVMLSGVALRGSSLAITLGPGNNSVSLKHCNVTGHEASHSSPVSISTNSSPHLSSVQLRDVRFHDNRRQRSRGAALSIFARFARQVSPALNVSVIDCSFANNSADGAQVAGAVYVANVARVMLLRCEFASNVAGDGGAVYIYSSSGVELNECLFTANAAVNQRQANYASRGGAVYAESSHLQLTDSQFINNTAQHRGSALSVSDATGVTLIRCIFTESSTSLPAPDDAILWLSARPATSSSAVIKLTDCRVQSALLNNHLLLTVCGPTSINNTSVSCQSDGMSLRHVALPATLYSAGYQLRQVSVWTQSACSTGSYSPVADTHCQLVLHGRLADLNDSAQLCYACPAHAHCDDAVARADYNYYVLSTGDGRARALMCPAGYCQPSNSSVGQPCTDGRTGLVCSGCEVDRVMSLHFNGFISCESRDSRDACINYASSSVAIVCFTFFYVVALLLLRLSSRQRHHRTPHQSALVNFSDVTTTSARVPANTSHVTTSRSLIGCLFPLVYFFQLLPSVYPRLMTSSCWLDRVIQFFTSVFHLYPAVFAAGQGFCLSDLTDETSSVAEQRYFFTMSVYWAQLVLIGLLFCLLSAVFLLSRGPFTEQNIKMLVSYFLSAFVFFQLFSNVPLLRAGLQSVHCVDYNDSSVVFSDAKTSCYASWQVFSMLYIIICVVPLCLVVDTAAFVLSRGRVSVLGYLAVCLFPLIGLVAVPVSNLRAAAAARRRRGGDEQNTRDEFEVDETTPEGLRSVSSHSVIIVQSVLIKPFSSYLSSSVVDVGWMTVILVRNCVVCMLSSLLEHVPAARSIVVTVACFCFTVDQLVCRGYSLRAANWLDAAAWFILSLLSTLDVYVSVVYESGHALSMWSLVDWIARLVAALPVVIVVVVIIILLTRAVLRRWRRTRSF